MQIKNERTDIYEREDAVLPIGKQDAMDDLLCIQAPKEVNTLCYTHLNAISSTKPSGVVVEALKVA
jgi:hypothetical protein